MVRHPVESGPGCEPVSIAVDARALQAAGIGRYLREILIRLLADARFRSIALLGDEGELHDFLADHAAERRARVVRHAGGFYSPLAQLSWLRVRRGGAGEADVVFFPHFDAPLLRLPARTVVTVHDLIHFKVPHAFPAWKRGSASAVLRRVTARARCILVPSESTRDDLVERIPATAPRVRVVPEGVGAPFGTGAPDGRPAGASPYLLCVGNRKPHKNLATSVEAFAILRAERPSLRLVIAGRSYAGWERVLARAEELGVGRAVVQRDEVSDAELRGLYAGCEALLFPSLYEGFGLPVLEAMACGAPVVASDRSSLPEVVGDAGLLVDPLDPDAIADAVRRLWSDPELRCGLIRRGRERAARFSWDATARLTLDALHGVATGGTRSPALEEVAG